MRILWPDGRIYKGDWNFTKGMMGEKGEFYWPDGSSYKTNFKFGKFHLTGTYTNSSGDKRMLYYKNGLRINMM